MKRELVAEKTEQGNHSWYINDCVSLIGNMKTVDVYYGSVFRFSMTHAEAQDTFYTHLYPAGTVLRDDSNKAKIERRRNKEEFYFKDMDKSETVL